MIIHSNLSKMKNKIYVSYRDSLEEFSNTSSGVLGAESEG